MVKDTYIPLRGDVVWLDFAPARGHEQDKVRPALIISDGTYNDYSGLALVCPISSKKRGHFFEVDYKSENVKGVVISNQVRSISWTDRGCKYIERANDEIINEVIARVKTMLD